MRTAHAILNFFAAAAVAAFTGWLAMLQLFVYGMALAAPNARITDALLFLGREVSYVIVLALLIVCAVFPTLFGKILPSRFATLRWYANYFVYAVLFVYVVFSDETGKWLFDEVLQRIRHDIAA